MNHIPANDHASRGNRDADAPFDAALRRQHAQSLDRLSARTSAQLQQRRHAALAGKPARRPAMLRIGVAVAASFAAAIAVLVGLQLRQPADVAATATDQVAISTSATSTSTTPTPPVSTPQVHTPQVVSAGTASGTAPVRDDLAAVADDDRLDSVFDEDPDFYLWLASNEAAGSH